MEGGNCAWQDTDMTSGEVMQIESKSGKRTYDCGGWVGLVLGKILAWHLKELCKERLHVARG